MGSGIPRQSLILLLALMASSYPISIIVRKLYSELSFPSIFLDGLITKQNLSSSAYSYRTLYFSNILFISIRLSILPTDFMVFQQRLATKVEAFQSNLTPRLKKILSDDDDRNQI